LAIDSAEASGRMCSSRANLDLLALDLDLHRHDLVVEQPASRAPRRAPVGLDRELVLALARDRAALGQVLRRDPISTDWNGSVRPPITGSTSFASPMRAPQRALGIQ
jgi:hypothetical protein